MDRFSIPGFDLRSIRKRFAKHIALNFLPPLAASTLLLSPAFLFAQDGDECRELPGVPPGLYTATDQGRTILEKDGKTLELGPGQAGFADLDTLTCINKSPEFLDWPCFTQAAQSRLFATYSKEDLVTGDFLKEVADRYFSGPEVLVPAPNWLDGEYSVLSSKQDLSRYDSTGYWFLRRKGQPVLSAERPRSVLMSFYVGTREVLLDHSMLDALLADPATDDIPVTFVFNDSNVVPISYFGRGASLEDIFNTFRERGIRAAAVPAWWMGDHHLKVSIDEFEKFFDIPSLEDIAPDKQAALRAELETDGFSKKPIMITLFSESVTMAVDQPERIRVAASMGALLVPTVLIYIEPDEVFTRCGPGIPTVLGAQAVSGAAAPGAPSAARRPGARQRRAAGRAPKGSRVEVFYGTDRKREASANRSKPNSFYSGERGELELGTVMVNIPPDHQRGELESPSIWKLRFWEDPEKDVMLVKISPLSERKFIQKLRRRVGDTQSAFIFVHGYNVTFKDAARRTAQMAVDLDFEGAPILYSWPSKGTLLGYGADENIQKFSYPHLKKFLQLIQRDSGASTIHLVAHSMGNRTLTRALLEIERENSLPVENPTKFNQIALVAPDIDAEIFKTDIAPFIVPVGERVTLYSSRADLALDLSQLKHDGRARAGDEVLVVDGIDTIDVTGLDTSLLGHSYYAESDSVITDLIKLLRGESPDKRSGLKLMDETNPVYWRFVIPH